MRKWGREKSVLQVYWWKVVLLCGGRTPEDVILVVLVGFGSHFYQTRESFCHHELVHQVLVILERGQGERRIYSRAIIRLRQSQRLNSYY